MILNFSNDCESEAPTENQAPNEIAPEQLLQRSTQERHQPNYYGMEQSHLPELQNEPTSIEEATTCPNSTKWIQAMETEMKSLESNDVWDLVELPAGRKAVGSMSVYLLMPFNACTIIFVLVLSLSLQIFL